MAHLNIHLTLIFPDFGLSGRPTNKFKQRAPCIVPEMPDWWLPTLVDTVLLGISKQLCRFVQKHNVSERKIISFYEVIVKTNL